MTRMKGTPAQLRKLRDESLRGAEIHIRAARKARKEAQDTARRIQEHQWQVEMHTDEPDSYWTKHWGKNDFSYLEGSMLRDLGLARAEEEKAEAQLVTAREAAYRYNLTQKHYIEPPWEGLLLLIRMCLLGRRNKRARRERSLNSIYHLQ